ncbi:hypothetical protein TERTU_4368 [Teredinibacter turnerae T7901]|uniref:Uncharacterized protein n=1 Tax=Teredinibacter turnerae (strain ATCC 39867 / T7901) TaxID=377629 RepID=C5BIW9_TERTT|nr:hypothetical protein TERTU_4368 [Teredinibacter turnerae T7901]
MLGFLVSIFNFSIETCAIPYLNKCALTITRITQHLGQAGLFYWADFWII